MFAGFPFAAAEFAQAIALISTGPTPSGGGIGGSGISNREYRRILKRLGAVTPQESLEEEEVAVLFNLV